MVRMGTMKWIALACMAVCLLASTNGAPGDPVVPAENQDLSSTDLSPSALAVSGDGRALYIACASAGRVVVFDIDARKTTRSLPVPAAPSGLASSSDGSRLFVTCTGAESLVCVLDTASGRELKRFNAGHTASSPVLSRDSKTLFVCNRFNDAVSVFDLDKDREVARVPVNREPVSAALTPDGRHLLVANHMPSGRADTNNIAAVVSVVDVARRCVVKELRPPNGSIALRQISVSPDGRHACVPMTLARYPVPVTQVERGWVNTSGLVVIDLGAMEIVNTVLLDDVDCGAANPWASGWTSDGRYVVVTHAGTHEMSVIDFPGLLAKLAALPATPSPMQTNAPSAARCAADVPDDLSFLGGLRRRVKLGGNGPRTVAVSGNRACVAGYFSDSLDVAHVPTAALLSRTVILNPGRELTTLRRGEMYFNDAALCFQGWQSCASCHEEDGRMDMLNWDLLNDGIGNPKNTKSLLLSHKTPPTMSLGIRSDAPVAVRAGILNSLATVLPENVAAAMDEWLQSLKPGVSPLRIKGRLSEAATRGQKIFFSAQTGCAACHPAGLFTDLRLYDVGTVGPFDRGAREYDTPTLVELWRTAPYLHDGSAATMREVLTTRNPKNEHGRTSHLDSRQLDDLVEYLLSL